MRVKIKKYLKLLGVEKVDKPSTALLKKLHRAHICKIPWQSLDIFLGEPGLFDAQSSIDQILDGRGGNCFKLNAAFHYLLSSLGFEVCFHRAKIENKKPVSSNDSFHLGLSVKLKGQRYLVDVGLGDIPLEPIPLIFGEYFQAPFKHKLTPSPLFKGGWRLYHDERGPFKWVDFSAKELEDLSSFRPNYQYLAYSKESRWKNILLIRKRNVATTLELRGRVLKKISSAKRVKFEIKNKTKWLNINRKVFNLNLENFTQEQLKNLLEKVFNKGGH